MQATDTMPQDTPSRKRLPRRSIDETRALMLAAAVSLLRGRVGDSNVEAVGSVLADVRLTEVAAEATRIVRSSLDESDSIDDVKDITTGAIYQVWPSQAQFQADLLLHIARLFATSESLIDELIPLIDGAVEAGDSVIDALRMIVDRSFEYTRESSLFYITLSFYARAANEQVRQALAASTDTFLADIRPVWQHLLDSYGLALVEPYELDDLALVIGALIDGLALEAVVGPGRVSDPGNDPAWSLPTRATAIIFNGMTKPASGRRFAADR